MSINVSQKGKFYFVEDTGANKVIGRFEDKDKANTFAKQKRQEVSDYFKGTKVNMTINSQEQLDHKI